MEESAILVDPALGARIAALKPDLDRMQLPACILDRDLRYRYTNAAYLAHFGRASADSFLDKTADEAFTIVPTDGRRGQLRRALDGETVVFDRVTIEGPQAGRWVRAHYLPVHDGDAVIGVQVMYVDIQHLKDVESDLAQRERQLALINESVGVPISYVDSDWRFRYTNQRVHLRFDDDPGQTDRLGEIVASLRRELNWSLFARWNVAHVPAAHCHIQLAIS